MRFINLSLFVDCWRCKFRNYICSIISRDWFSFAAATATPQEAKGLLKSENVVISCKSCQGECSSTSNLTAYYHHPVGKFNLCAACFTAGKYSAEFSSADFVKIDPSSFPASGMNTSSDWTEEELLKLMEAIEKYSDSGVNMAANNVWDAIAEECRETTWGLSSSIP